MKNDNGNKFINGSLIAHYKFDNPEDVGQDFSGNGNDGTASGTKLPAIKSVAGRQAVSLAGENMAHPIFHYLTICLKRSVTIQELRFRPGCM